MTTINKNFRTPTGKNVTADLTIENYKVSGTANINGTAYGVTGFAVVQGKKVLQITGAPAPYLQIHADLYDELNAICKAQFAAQMTPLEIAEGKMREAENKYNKLFAQGWNNVAIIEAREEWNRLSAEYHKLAK